MTARGVRDTGRPDTAVAALLRCAVREIAAPGGRTRTDDAGRLVIGLGGREVRARFHGGIALDLGDEPEIRTDGAWRRLTLDDLVALVEHELPGDNTEFAAQVHAGRQALARIGSQPPPEPVRPDDVAETWLRSEQSLADGHPFHPSPKSHLSGTGWQYAPERRARFGLRLFGVPVRQVLDHGDPDLLDQLGAAPPGQRIVPLHPWQATVLGLGEGGIPAGVTDLGTSRAVAVPTSSVRTVYVPDLRRCLKLSLHVRITNCVRKNAWYELAGAVELTARLREVGADLNRMFPGTRVLAEPAARTTTDGGEPADGWGVIIREDPVAAAIPGSTPLVAAALAQPGSEFSARALAGDDIDRWWESYLQVVALPVLYAYARHGVVFEAHVQNILVAVDASGRPSQVIVRDLEGTKLVAGRHDVSGLDPRIATAICYDHEAAWRRLVYCLIVNHLAQIAAVLAGGDDAVLARLWRTASSIVTGQPWADPAIAGLGVVPTLPAKANLAVRWSRAADRHAGYVSVPNPLRR